MGKYLKRIKRNMLLLLILGTVISCSKDDDNNNSLAGVPSGEIVAVELRNVTLTGFSNISKSNQTQKWWTHVITKITIDKAECGDDQEQESVGYFAFYRDGGLYVKTSKDGTAVKGGSWSWTDSSKTYVSVTIQGEVQDFKLTYLNADNVVYGSVQTSGGCSAITYEKFNAPFFE